MRLLGLLFLFIAQLALAHQSSITTSQKEIRWNYVNVPIKVINNSSFSTAGTLIDQSLAEWNAASGFQISKVSSSLNSIKFSSDPTIFGSAVVGVTELNYNKSGVINNATIYLNEQQVSETRNTGKAYLKDVVTHELGHFVGLGHSEVLNSSMFYLNYPGQADVAADDKAGIRSKYDSGYGKIYGYVKGGSHIGVLGVHVQAISRKSGQITSAISDDNGYFALTGLDLNDTYYLYTSPLRNLNALSSLYANVQNEFCPSSYIGSFFSACGRENDGLPQGISLSSSRKTVDIGVVSINCNMRAQEDYTYEKLQTVFSPLTIFNFGDEQRYEKSFVGFFHKSQLSTTSWTEADQLQIDLKDLDPTNKTLRIRLVSQPLGNSIEYSLSVYRNGAFLGTHVKTLVSPENIWKLDLEVATNLSSTASDNVYELEVRAKKLTDFQAYMSIPDLARFGTDQSLPYLLNLSLEDSGSAIINTAAILSDNSSCLDAPFTYAVKKTSAFTEETNNTQKAATAAACGTIEPPSGPGPGTGAFMLLIGFGFFLTQLASSLVKRGKNFLS